MPPPAAESHGPFGQQAKWNALPKHVQEMVVTATRQHPWDQYAYIQKGNVADWSMCGSGGLLEERVRELLAGQVLGLVGLGRIGREVVKRVRGFDVRAVYYDPVRPAAAVEAEPGVSYRPFDELLRTADLEGWRS
jgi:phosphoglycerate dehydrogenase-like enzyme